MDVSCPRCKTEYEFDDARVPESGVTVKCTSCNHVFRVRKKSAPAPQQPSPMARVGDETIPAKSPLLQQPATREWKVRQPSGNIFSFKELTTLQKWIVERKVSRDDEISLTGEAWKRLGNIAELASFFQIVDDAKKVHELEALQQMKGARPEPEVVLPPPPPPPPEAAPRAASQSGSMPAPGERAGVQRAFEGTPPQPQPKLNEAPARPPPQDDPREKLVETLREPSFGSLPPRPPPEDRPVYRPPPLPIQRREILPGIEEETQRPGKSGSGAGTIIAILLVLAGIGGAGGYYFLVMMPEQARAKEAAELEAKAKAEAEAKQKEDEARQAAEKAEAERKAKEAAARPPVVDAGAVVVKKPVPAPDVDDNGEPKEAVKEPKEPKEPREPKEPKEPAPPKEAKKKSPDYWISQGDRLRDKDRAEAAMDAYSKALEVSPENIEALTGKALCMLDMAKPLQAEPLLEQALKLNPRYAPAIMGLAESYRFQGKKESAISMYQKYLDAFPNGPEAGVARSNIERLK